MTEPRVRAPEAQRPARSDRQEAASEAARWLALLDAPPALRGAVKRALYVWCVEQRRSWAEFSSLQPEERVSITGMDAQALASVIALEGRAPEAMALLRDCYPRGIRVLLRTDAAYPEDLLTRLTEERLPYFWQYKGDLDMVHHPKVAVLGTGKPGPDAVAAAEGLVRSVIAEGYVLIGGCEPGIGRASLEMARAAGAGIVSILPAGMLHAGDMLPQGWDHENGSTLVMSPYPPDAAFTSLRERAGRALAMALSDAVYLFAPDDGPDAHLWARELLEKGLPVSVWEGDQGKGTLAWLAAGARPFSAMTRYFPDSADSEPHGIAENDGQEEDPLRPFDSVEEAIDALERLGRVPRSLAARLHRLASRAANSGSEGTGSTSNKPTR